jgi:two-component system phosphate regulon sensor histidine kinase PhoR
MWPTLLILTALALGGWHWYWRQRQRTVEAGLRREIESLQTRQAEALAREQAQREALFNSMVEGFLLLDEAGRIQISNRAFQELFDIGGDLRGRTVLEVLRLHELADLTERLTREERVLGRELHLGGPGGRCVEVNAAAIRNGGGARRGAILVFHDLTRIKQLESASTEFVANVSHELRTPLSMIKGYVETLLGGAKDDPATATKFLQTIERHSNRLALLIEDLLTSSELESGRAVLQFKPVALRLLTAKVIEDFAPRAQPRNVRLLSELPDLTARADADRLQQVFANLVDNAIKYGRPGGSVTLGGQVLDDRRLQLCVRDDGPGLPPEAVGRIFERFYRVDKARSREAGGTGLGLSIVKDIVQAHGGEVWAESQPGQGAAFFFTLPRGDLRETAPQAERVVENGASAVKG